MLKFISKIIFILISKFWLPISVVLSFIAENFISIAKYIPISDEYNHELNIALYTFIFNKLMTWLKNHFEKSIINIEGYFFENIHNANKDLIEDVIERELGEDASRVYLKVKYSGYYKDLKKYWLEIIFPTWVDLNEIRNKGLVRLDEKDIDQGSSLTKIIMDFSKLDIEEDNYKEGSKTIPLDFIINSIDNLGDKELIEINIKSKKRIELHKFKSNKLRLYRDIKMRGGG